MRLPILLEPEVPRRGVKSHVKFNGQGRVSTGSGFCHGIQTDEARVPNDGDLRGQGREQLVHRPRGASSSEVVSVVQAKPTHSPHLVPGVVTIQQTREQRFQPKVPHGSEGACSEAQSCSDVASAIADHDVCIVR